MMSNMEQEKAAETKAALAPSLTPESIIARAIASHGAIDASWVGEELARAILAALAAAGMKVLGREPTKAMCDAAPALPAIHVVDDLPLAKDGWRPAAVQNLKRWRAMFDAAAPVAGKGE